MTDKELMKIWNDIYEKTYGTWHGSEKSISAVLTFANIIEQQSRQQGYEAGIMEERHSWAGVITTTEWEHLKAHETDTNKFTKGCARDVCRLMNEAEELGRKRLVERLTSKETIAKLYAYDEELSDALEEEWIEKIIQAAIKEAMK